jgi:hypothetical protein
VSLFIFNLELTGRKRNCLLQALFQKLYLAIEILNRNDVPYLVFLKILFIIFVFVDFRKEIIGWVGESLLDEDVF